MKRFISTLLAVLMTLTAFGAATVFGGANGASAVFFDYYEYTQFPGLNAFNADDYALAWKDMSYQEKRNEGAIVWLLGLSLLMAYLFLAA